MNIDNSNRNGWSRQEIAEYRMMLGMRDAGKLPGTPSPDYYGPVLGTSWSIIILD